MRSVPFQVRRHHLVLKSINLHKFFSHPVSVIPLLRLVNNIGSDGRTRGPQNYHQNNVVSFRPYRSDVTTDHYGQVTPRHCHSSYNTQAGSMRHMFPFSDSVFECGTVDFSYKVSGPDADSVYGAENTLSPCTMIVGRRAAFS
jgi:hypothetical protein